MIFFLFPYSTQSAAVMRAGEPGGKAKGRVLLLVLAFHFVVVMFVMFDPANRVRATGAASTGKANFTRCFFQWFYTSDGISPRRFA